ncbi:GNAT family N-acetyltransferase [Peterkaempfera griseoplana]|uniref:GNAT family N-acetyltransferase n=1 Tax=Peterkaempfera griseoplana TaxID=66896 RepID=UPI00099EC956|nr:GNAT family N-acetyltransferase [Peterkaempfera griseoplana]
MHPICRRGPRLTLRQLTVEDVDAVHTIYGSPEATAHLSFEPRSLDQVGAIVTRSIASAAAEPRDEYAVAVIESASGALVGFARLAANATPPR